MRNAAAKITFIIHTFNATFLDKSHGDSKRIPIQIHIVSAIDPTGSQHQNSSDSSALSGLTSAKLFEWIEPRISPQKNQATSACLTHQQRAQMLKCLANDACPRVKQQMQWRPLIWFQTLGETWEPIPCQDPVGLQRNRQKYHGPLIIVIFQKIYRTLKSFSVDSMKAKCLNQLWICSLIQRVVLLKLHVSKSVFEHLTQPAVHDVSRNTEVLTWFPPLRLTLSEKSPQCHISLNINYQSIIIHHVLVSYIVLLYHDSFIKEFIIYHRFNKYYSMF